MVRFETNRNFTGMGHESFSSMEQAVGNRPVHVIARLLLGTGKVDRVHIYNNIVGIDVAKGYDDSGFADLIANMYEYWVPGRELPSFDEPAAEAAAATDGGGGGASSGPSDYELKIPAHLRERSAAARAKASA